MAVQVYDAYKKYGDGSPVLRNMNMSVPQGSIYGLLGSSGCGKTTLLSCIVGLSSLNSGGIRIFGKETENIHGILGYMPQNECLYKELTIREMITLFGRVYGLTDTMIYNRVEQLLKFLQLPKCSTLISNLSGGELRRTSLAVALIHEPNLLILDEPCVGLDPLLREEIWDHLKHLVKTKGTTILLTTHYIEETRNCDTIGIMRNGKLLAEDSPLAVMGMVGSPNLQDAILKLCHNDEIYNDQTLPNKIIGNDLGGVGISNLTKTEHYDTSTFTGNCDITSASRKKSIPFIQITFALMIRNFWLQIRNPLILGFQTAIPICQIILGSAIIGTDPTGINMHLVNGDHANLGSDLLGTCKQWEMNRTKCFETQEFAVCSFLSQFKPEDFHWKEVLSVEEALKSITLGASKGYIQIPSNYQKHFTERLIFQNFVGNESIEGSTISSKLDMTNMLTGNFITEKLLAGYAKFSEEVVISCQHNPLLVQIPLKVNPIYGKLNGGWTEYANPGTIVGLSYLLPMGIAAILFALDISNGTKDRLVIAGVGAKHYIISAIISQTLFFTVQLSSTMFIMLAIYKLEILGNWATLIILLFLLSIAGITFGLLLSNLFHNPLEVVGICFCAFTINSISSGAAWPLEGVIWWYRIFFCRLLPVSIPLMGFRSVVDKGWGLEHADVKYAFLASFLWIIIAILGIAFTYRRHV